MPGESNIRYGERSKTWIFLRKGGEMVNCKSSMCVGLVLLLVLFLTVGVEDLPGQSQGLDAGSPSAVQQVDSGVWIIGRPAPLFEIGLTNDFDNSVDGDWLAFGSDRELVLFDRTRNVIDHRVPLPVPVWHVQFSPDSRRVAVVLFEPTVVLNHESVDEAELRVWDVDRNRFAMKQTISSADLTDFSRPAFSGDGRLLVIGGRTQDVVRSHCFRRRPKRWFAAWRSIARTR